MPQTRRRSRKGTQRIGPLKKGRLTKFGYTHVKELSERERHGALRKAVNSLGSLTVWKMVNVLYVYNKKHAATGALFKSDRDWIEKTFGI